MKVLVYHGPNDVRLDDKPCPIIIVIITGAGGSLNLEPMQLLQGFVFVTAYSYINVKWLGRS